MIITVTMNPAIDKTIEIGEFVHGGMNRIKRVIRDAGGKGINVSKTIAALGGESIATGFAGGSNGNMIEQSLKVLGIQTDFIHVSGETRVNTKVFEADGTLTELNEPGPEITIKEMEELRELLKRYAGKDTLVVLSGSIPKLEEPMVKEEIYRDLIHMLHESGAEVLLDADGEVFRKAIEAGPDMIKPNIVELEQYCGEKLGDEEIQRCCEQFQKHGTSKIVVSRGSEGAFFYLNGYKCKSPALPVKIHSTVGAGDAMVAALSLAREEKLSEKETAILCMAVSAGAVMTEGTKPPCKEMVEGLKKKVCLSQVG